MPENMPYRFYANRQPAAAAARNDLAKTYRALRHDRPNMARLLFRRYQEAARQLQDRVDPRMD